MVVARALLDNVTRESGNTEVACVAMMDIYATYQDVKVWSINYNCCSSNVSSIHCDLSIVGSKWLQAIKASLVLFVLRRGIILPCIYSAIT